METDGAGSAPSTVEDRRNLQVDNAIRAIREKKPVPEIDFSIHTMEDGSQVSTQERVCKGESPSYLSRPRILSPSSCPLTTIAPRYQMCKRLPC